MKIYIKKKNRQNQIVFDPSENPKLANSHLSTKKEILPSTFFPFSSHMFYPICSCSLLVSHLAAFSEEKKNEQGTRNFLNIGEKSKG